MINFPSRQFGRFFQLETGIWLPQESIGYDLPQLELPLKVVRTSWVKMGHTLCDKNGGWWSDKHISEKGWEGEHLIGWCVALVFLEIKSRKLTKTDKTCCCCRKRLAESCGREILQKGLGFNVDFGVNQEIISSKIDISKVRKNRMRMRAAAWAGTAPVAATQDKREGQQQHHPATTMRATRRASKT